MTAQSQNTLILVFSGVFFTNVEDVSPACVKESLTVTAKKGKF